MEEEINELKEERREETETEEINLIMDDKIFDKHEAMCPVLGTLKHTV
jgi:hypothetical protein